MKHVTALLDHGAETRHPMHQFVVETDGYTASKLLNSTVTAGDVHTALFHIQGWPPEPYETALLETQTVQEYAIATQPDNSFAVYVREALADIDRQLVDSLARTGLVTLFPIVYREDGIVEVTLVGPGEELQAALESVPAPITVDVVDIGAYDNRQIEGSSNLTDRQYEAVAHAVECGYYDDPRAASTGDVADELGCAPSTAAEHLRRAERTIMRRTVGVESG